MSGTVASETGRRRRRLAPALTVITVAALIVAGVVVAPRVHDAYIAEKLAVWLDDGQPLELRYVSDLEGDPGVWRALAARVRGRPDAICLPDRRIFVGVRDQQILVFVEHDGDIDYFVGNPAERVWCNGEGWRLASVRLDVDDQPEVVFADGTVWGSSLVMGLARRRFPINVNGAQSTPQLLRAVLQGQLPPSRRSSR